MRSFTVLLCMMLALCLLPASAEPPQEAEPAITMELSADQVDEGANISVSWTVKNPLPGQNIMVTWRFEGSFLDQKVFGTEPEGTMEVKAPEYFGGQGSVTVAFAERTATGYLLRLEKTLPFTVKGALMPKIINLKIDKEGEVQGGETVTATWEATAPLPENCAFHVNWKSSGYLEDRYAEFSSSFQTRFSDPNSYVEVSLIRGFEPEDFAWAEATVHSAKVPFVVVGETPPVITGTCSAQGGVVKAGEPVTITWEVEHMPKGARVDVNVNAGSYFVVKDAKAPFTFVPRYGSEHANISVSVEEKAYDDTPWTKPYSAMYQASFKVEGEAAPTITSEFTSKQVRPGERITASWEIIGNAKDTKVKVEWYAGKDDPILGEVVDNTSSFTVPLDYQETELFASFILLTLDGQQIDGASSTAQVVFQGDATGDGKVETDDLGVLAEHWVSSNLNAEAIENAIADPEKGLQVSDFVKLIELIVGD